MEFRNRIYKFFLKGKNSVTGLMTGIAIFDFFLYNLHERRPIGKDQRQAKTWFNGKAFCYKADVLF